MTVVEPVSESNEKLTISIRACNSIDEAEVTLQPGSLNVKYGPNGIGKSTIARALRLHAENEGDLDDLTPFKYRDIEDAPKPSVEGAEGIASVLTFDDSYVSQFVFKEDEVLQNSFEIFINTEEYRQGEKAIEGLFGALKNVFSQHEAFNAAQDGFEKLLDAFKITQKGAVSKSSRGLKALDVGEKLNNIPGDLLGYKNFLHSSDAPSWITWQSKGETYLKHSENCPFCSKPSVNKETTKRVSEEYNSAAVKNMSDLQEVLQKVGQYLENSYRERLEELTTSIKGFDTEEQDFIASLRLQVEGFLQRLTNLKDLSFHTLREHKKDMPGALRALKLDLSDFGALNSVETRTVVSAINLEIDQVESQIKDVQKQIGRHDSEVRKLITRNQKDINSFLDSAGYRYRVRIDDQDGSYRMLLEHQDASGHIESASSHLSYGEKNAFALVLFMHQAVREQPSLVVLDDPVSSFDKTKKFAILHQLFRGSNSLQGVTTLFLTHDIEPAIDLLRTNASRKFSVAKPVVHFLRGAMGVVAEKVVNKNDIMTFAQVCKDNIANSEDSTIKCIYLRRLFETHGSLGSEYDVISSLLHARPEPTDIHETPLSEEEIATAFATICTYVPDFNYRRLLMDLKTPGSLKRKFNATEVGYEKVQLFRMIQELGGTVFKDGDVLMNFVNETYHIENEYIMQLNPREFDAVPEYVIEACTNLVEEVK